MVALMGIAFLVTAVALGPDPGALLRGVLLPLMPAGSTAVVIGLVGTTVVPYNLFLGSSLARDGDLRTARFGMAVAIGLGGLMTAATVVAGSAVIGELSFGALAAVLSERLGAWAGVLFGLGLLGAGLSSAVTAPLAAALTVQGVAGAERAPTSSWRFRAVWIGVLATGLGFGLAEVRPIPAILLAQVLNGVMLPLAAVILVVAVNDRSRVGDAHLPGGWHAAALGLAATVTVVLGVSTVIRAVAAVVGAAPPSAAVVLAGACAVAVLVLAPIARRVMRGREG
jgi:Mn2+/Fe2+ NRAMP family transporter